MQEADFGIRTMTGGTMHLSQAVLIYESGGDKAFATVHNVEEVDGQPVILAGQAMTASAASLLCRALSKNNTHGGFMPETVLYTDGDLLVWWVPPAERHIVFRAPELKEKWLEGLGRPRQTPTDAGDTRFPCAVFQRLGRRRHMRW
jgi:PRTRC genetic system protein B